MPLEASLGHHVVEVSSVGFIIALDQLVEPVSLGSGQFATSESLQEFFEFLRRTMVGRRLRVHGLTGSELDSR